MPEEAEEGIQASLRKAHPDWSEEKIEDVTFATMNKKGMLRGKGGRKKHARQDHK